MDVARCVDSIYNILRVKYKIHFQPDNLHSSYQMSAFISTANNVRVTSTLLTIYYSIRKF